MATKSIHSLPITLILENNQIKVQRQSDSIESNLNFDSKIECANDLNSGLSGDYYTLSVEYENDAAPNLNLFIKTLPLRYPIECSRVKQWRLFEREKIMYTIIDDMFKEKLNGQDNVYPRPFGIYEHSILCDNILLLGYNRLDSVSITPEITKTCLEHLANMHAQNMAFVISKNGAQYLQNDSPMKDPLLRRENPWIHAGIAAILKLALKDSRNQSDEQKDFIENQLAIRINSIFDLTSPPDNEFKVICHCDLRPKNIFLKVEDNNGQSSIHFKFLDYQEARFVPPAIDILLFLFYNLRKPIATDENISEYCNYYYEKLNVFCQNLNITLEEHLSLKSFRESVEQYTPLAKIMRALYAPFLCDFRYAARLRTDDIEKYINCMAVDRMTIIDKFCDENTKKEEFLFESNQAVVELFNTEQ